MMTIVREDTMSYAGLDWFYQDLVVSAWVAGLENYSDATFFQDSMASIGGATASITVCPVLTNTSCNTTSIVAHNAIHARNNTVI